MNWDRLLGRIKVNRKPMSLHRLQWWMVIILTRLFGRRVQIHEAGGRTLRLLPIVWGGKVYLLGSEHEYLQIDYTGPYTLRVKRSPEFALTDGEPIRLKETDHIRSVIHVVVCHLPPAATELLLHYIKNLSDSYTLVLAYGGSKENFEAISWPHKVFVDDPLMRGLSYLYSYYRLINEVRSYLQKNRIEATWVFVTDYDLLPLQKYYLDELATIMTRQQAGFGGKLIRDLSLSNSLFLTNALDQGRVDDTINGPGKTPVYHCLGAGLLFFRDCFNSIFQEEEPFNSANLELAVPTAARRAGYRLLSFDKHSADFANVEYRPLRSAADGHRLAAQGVRFVHPLKAIDEFSRLKNIA